MFKKTNKNDTSNFDINSAKAPKEKKNDIWDENLNLINSNEGETISENNIGFIIKPENFEELEDYVKDDSITDIDFNGSDLWLTNANNQHWKDTELNVTPNFIRRLAQNIANSQSSEFNQKEPVLEAETKDLRISIIHNSIAKTGTTMCIRKTPTINRISEREAIETGYTTLEILSLLANCIQSHMNIVICGEPRAGKTEFAKFISGFIPEGERVITIEDVMEWHYKELHPTADVIELKTNKDFTYSDGIIASLKQNPKWIMIAETRGQEVKNLIQSFTTGVNGITTLHTDDVRKIPSRIVNMADDSLTAKRMENNVYEFIDVGIFISMHPNKNGGMQRTIDQVAFFSGVDESKKITMMVNNGELLSEKNIPEKIMKKFELAEIADIYKNNTIYENLKNQGYDLSKKI